MSLLSHGQTQVRLRQYSYYLLLHFIYCYFLQHRGNEAAYFLFNLLFCFLRGLKSSL